MRHRISCFPAAQARRRGSLTLQHCLALIRSSRAAFCFAHMLPRVQLIAVQKALRKSAGMEKHRNSMEKRRLPKPRQGSTVPRMKHGNGSLSRSTLMQGRRALKLSDSVMVSCSVWQESVASFCIRTVSAHCRVLAWWHWRPCRLSSEAARLRSLGGRLRQDSAPLAQPTPDWSDHVLLDRQSLLACRMTPRACACRALTCWAGCLAMSRRAWRQRMLQSAVRL
mmetsp:Transcript_14181/g.38509  ORF Transcript_14181/g.38509 Transcript_14181/m.38509 type:complete len:224 (-) Transcript_14181:153-824(-)